MKLILLQHVLVLSLSILFSLPILYGQENEGENEEKNPKHKSQYPIFKDIPPYELQLNSFPTNKFKSFVGGYGVIVWAFKAETLESKEQTKNVVTSHGISVGFKAIDNFYNSKIPIELGMYYSSNILMGFAASAISEKTSNQKKEFFQTDKAIKHVVANFSIGPHISIPNDYITTQLGIGISAGLLFHHLFYKENKFYLTIGIGPSLDLEFLFRFSQLLGVSLAFQLTYHPLLIDSLYESIKYESSGLFLSSIQLGIIVLSY